jgi:argininosuccinate synthase
MDETQKTVTGTVRLKLYKGNCTVMGRKASKSLYDENIVTFEEGDGYRQDDADGFIRLNALRLKMYSKTYGVK